MHTTTNYTGQLTYQVGIRGFWESRVPELQAKDYPLWVGQAEYIESPLLAIWDAVATARAQDSVLRIEKELTQNFSADQNYSYEERNNLAVRVYSREFTEAYALALDSQIERQI